MQRFILVTILCMISVLPHFLEAKQDEIVPDASYTIRSVRVEGGWLPDYQPPFDLPIAFSYDQIFLAIQKAKEDFVEKQKRFDQLLGGEYVSTLYVSYRTEIDNSNVDVFIRLISLGMKQIKIGDNKVPYPVFPIPSNLDRIPDGILKYAPRVGLTSDRTYGIAAELGFSIDCSNWLNSGTGATSPSWIIQMDGRKSLEEDFYNARAITSYRKRVGKDHLKSVSLKTSVEGDASPKIDRKLDHLSLKTGGGLRFQHDSCWFKHSIVGGFYSYSDREFDETGIRTEDEAEVHRGDFYLVTGGRIKDALIRMGIWLENGFPDTGNSFNKLATTFGLGHEISLQKKRSNLTIGIDLMAGAGYAFSNLPQYAAYFGGNRSMNFLYESLESGTLAGMPSGPLFRGVGEQQLGLETDDGLQIGGSAYWHVNLNVAVPLPFAYFPLIPDEQVVGETTLKEVVKNSVGRTQKSLLATYLASEYPEWGDEKAKQEAEGIIENVRPAVEYLADKANVYALKPIFMMDCASVGKKDFSDQDIRLGLGGGVQLSIVNARFEVGYMRTVKGLDSDDKDNIFARIFFRSLF